MQSVKADPNNISNNVKNSAIIILCNTVSYVIIAWFHFMMIDYHQLQVV